MPYQHTTGDDFTNSRGNDLEVEGWFHVLIESMEDPAVSKKDGSILAGAAFGVNWVVMNGTAEGQKGKKHDETFWAPKPADTAEQQKRATLKIDRLALAASLITEADKGKAIPDFAVSVGRQMVVKFVKKKETERFLTCWSDIYHVDDPVVKDIPKDVAAIARIPKERRLIGQQPAPAKTAAPVPPKVDPASI